MTEMPPGTFTDQAFDPDDPTAPERLERIGTNGAKKNRRGADGEKTTRADNVGSTAAGLDDEAHVKLDEWDASADVEPPPPRGWLLGNTFCRKFMSSLYGDGAVGKTAVRYAQYLALATGRPLTGEHVFQRCRVLIISLEDGADELRRRILAARIHHRIELEELRDWLFLSAPGPEVGKLMTVDQKGRGVRGQLAEVIERAVVARQIDFVGLDPFVKTHSVDENHNSLIDDVVQILTDLEIKYDIAVDVPHHTSKGQPEPGKAGRGRGASSMTNAMRLVYTLAQMTPDEAEAFNIEESARREYVRYDSAKVNTTRHLGAAKWFHLVGIRLGNETAMYPHGDEVQTVETWTPPSPWRNLTNHTLNQILTEIDAGLPDGNRYTDAAKAEKREAWKVVVAYAPDRTEDQAREIIRTWIKNGVLEVRRYENPVTRKEVNGLWLNPSRRPS
jgi:hypothetical protein